MDTLCKLKYEAVQCRSINVGNHTILARFLGRCPLQDYNLGKCSWTRHSKKAKVCGIHSLAEASTLQLPTTSPHGVIWRTKKRIDKPLLNFQVKSSIHSAELWRSGGATKRAWKSCNSCNLASLRIVDGTVNFLCTSGFMPNENPKISMDFASPSGLVPSPASACPRLNSHRAENRETSSTLVAYVRLSLLPSTATANCRFLTLES